MPRKPKITVYITCFNYERFVEQAIESVLNQTYKDFELLIFDDGSTDGSREIINRYARRKNVTAILQENKGLPRTANEAMKRAKGGYLVRLDADDYLDENFLLVLSKLLDIRKDVDLVYPDYYEIDENDKVIGMVRRKKLSTKDQVHDLPAHGACTMVRTAVLRKLGGYDDKLRCQDGYDLWVRFIQKHKPYNINLPLFYYRKHAESITATSKRILKARKEIKKRFVEKNGKPRSSCIIIPIRRDSPIEKDLPLKKVAGKRLMDYAIDAALGTEAGRVVVVTEDADVAKAASRNGITVITRPKKLAKPGVSIEPTVTLVLDRLKKAGFSPDIIAVQFYTSPLVKSEHLDEAIHTLQIFDTDTVIGVTENNRLHYVHETRGLKPLFAKRAIKSEREFLYEESGAFIVSKSAAVSSKSLMGTRIGHVVLADEENLDIEDQYTLKLVTHILENRKGFEQLHNQKIKRGY